jgi:hypothetical protein
MSPPTKQRRPRVGRAAQQTAGQDVEKSVTQPADCDRCDIARCDRPDPHACPVHGELHRWLCLGGAS